MNEIAIALFGIFLLLAIVMTVPTVFFVRTLYHAQRPDIPDEQLPPAAIVLCVRGGDESLRTCLEGLMRQRYPQYCIRIVVDSQDDPAWETIQAVMSEFPNSHVRADVLRTKHATCSLKCSALVQAVSDLEERWEAIAFVDADVAVHPTWLRELVTPLLDPQVGATTGNRWYVPQSRQWGSIFRYLWNAAAVVNMAVQQFPWAGSLAMTRAVIHRTNMLNMWQRSISDDAPVQRAMQQQGLAIRFVPTLMMVNRETCSLPTCLNFVTRQLLTTRLYQNWLTVVLPVAITTFLVVLATVLLVSGLLSNNMVSTTWLASGLLVYLLTLSALLGLIEHSIRHALKLRGIKIPPLSPAMIVQVLVAIPLTQLGYAIATALATRVRQLKWRGIIYEIKGPWHIRLVNYVPYRF